MYCPHTLNKTGQKVARTTNDLHPRIQHWYTKIEEACIDILVHDIANHKYNKGVAVFGDNCCRFLDGPTSPYLSSGKLQDFLATIASRFVASELEVVRLLLQTDPRPKRMLIKGHFLSNAVSRLVSTLAMEYRNKKVIVSGDMLYGMTVDGCKSCDHEECPDFLATNERWRRALSALKK